MNVVERVYSTIRASLWDQTPNGDDRIVAYPPYLDSNPSGVTYSDCPDELYENLFEIASLVGIIFKFAVCNHFMKLRAENLVKIYKGRKVVKEVSLEVNRGEIVGLLGPNGAGKTTSFYMIVGLIKPNNGKIFLDQNEITQFPMYKRAQHGIGYLAQEASVFRKLTIEENILSVLQLTKLSKKEQLHRMESLIEEFGLGHIRKNRGDLLSGGERRRTEIARALATSPNFILLDEPFAGVDPVAVEDIQRIVAQLKNKNIGILITDHNVQETLAITDRTYLMFEGSILKHGVPEELANDDMVRKVYLGQNFELRKKKLDL